MAPVQVRELAQVEQDEIVEAALFAHYRNLVVALLVVRCLQQHLLARDEKVIAKALPVFRCEELGQVAHCQPCLFQLCYDVGLAYRAILQPLLVRGGKFDEHVERSGG